jgi:hypothetical protein
MPVPLLVFFFPFGIALNDWKNSGWNFVLIQEESDKGFFVARAYACLRARGGGTERARTATQKR